MIDHELTDPTGSALTITHNDDGTWITATQDRDEVTVGPLPARALRASFDMGDDLMDGGVTAAAVEAETIDPDRARSLVQEREEARAGSRYWFERFERAEENVRAREEMINRFAARAERAERGEHYWETRALESEDRERAATASPRPMRAEDITAEMVERAQLRIKKRATFIPAETIRCALEDALTEPTPEPTDFMRKAVGFVPAQSVDMKWSEEDAQGFDAWLAQVRREAVEQFIEACKEKRDHPGFLLPANYFQDLDTTIRVAESYAKNYPEETP